jgi:hypothetical protein
MSCTQDNIKLLNALVAEDTATVQVLTRAAQFDFDQFQAFTDLHHLSGYLYVQIKDSPVEDFFPPPFMERLGSRYSEQRQRCDDILREAALLFDIFQAANQDVLFIKGPFVAQQFYGDIYQRSYMDIDILVPRDDVLASDKLLRDSGFTRRSLMFISNDAMTRFIHAYEYRKRIAENPGPGRREYLPLDLHWVLQVHFSFRLDYEQIWKQQEQCFLAGKKFPVLGKEYALVLTALGILVDIKLGTIRLKSFLDLYKMLDMLDSELDWDAFFQKRMQENIFVITLNVIDLVLTVFDCRSRFPCVARYIEDNQQQIRLSDSSDKYLLLERTRFSRNNIKWAISLYQGRALQSLMWSFLSIPFRVAAHESRDPRFVKKLRDRRI